MNDRSDSAVGWAGTGAPAPGAVGGYVDMSASLDPFILWASTMAPPGPRSRELCGDLDLRPTVTTVPFESLASAIDDVRDGRARGSLVLLVEDRDAPP